MELAKVTLVAGAGPRLTSSTSKPCAGLQYNRYAPPCSHLAAALPPPVVRILPALLVLGCTAGCVAAGRCLAGREAAGEDFDVWLGAGDRLGAAELS